MRMESEQSKNNDDGDKGKWAERERGQHSTSNRDRRGGNGSRGQLIQRVDRSATTRHAGWPRTTRPCRARTSGSRCPCPSPISCSACWPPTSTTCRPRRSCCSRWPALYAWRRRASRRTSSTSAWSNCEWLCFWWLCFWCMAHGASRHCRATWFVCVCVDGALCVAWFPCWLLYIRTSH